MCFVWGIRFYIFKIKVRLTLPIFIHFLQLFLHYYFIFFLYFSFMLSRLSGWPVHLTLNERLPVSTEMSRSNLERRMDYSNWSILWFSQSLQENADIVHLIGPFSPPSPSFPIHYTLIILKFRALQSELVLNYLSTTPWAGMGKWMYRSTFYWLRHYLEVSGQLHAPAAYSRGKRPLYPLTRRLGGPQSRPGRRGEEKILDTTGTRTPTPRPSSP
jgi:hypothetical protein